MELSTNQSNLQQRMITRLTHLGEIDHSGKDILKANIEKLLPYEHPFEGDGYVLVPLQRDTPTGYYILSSVYLEMDIY